MHCSKCKTVIDKGVMIKDMALENNWYDLGELYYCKKCFKNEFIMNERNK